MLRRLWRGQGERGDTRYSSQKLISEGFIFPLGVEDTVKQLISTLRSK
jgi:hypothetical protein